MRILLVRHGQSTWNAAGRWQGQADPPLSPVGEQQADAGAASAELAGVRAWWASDLHRARDTATRLAAGRGPVHLDARLRERHAGAWEGLTRAEIERGWPGFLAGGRRPAGWEDDDLVTVRALDALLLVAGAAADVAAGADGGDALVVTHGGVVRAVERSLGADDGILGNLAGRWVTVDDHGVALGSRVLLVDPDAVTVPGQI